MVDKVEDDAGHAFADQLSERYPGGVRTRTASRDHWVVVHIRPTDYSAMAA